MMNIKRMPSCIAVVVAALLLAVSCGNMLEAPKAEGVEGGMGRLSVSMGDGRAVFPEELEFGTDKELTFTLSGSLSGGEGKEIRSWTAGGDKTAHQVMAADTSLTVEAGRWSFTLQAKRGGTVVATANKDLEVKGGQENRLSFGTMAYSNEGTGTVTVTLSWNEGEEVTSVVAGLYNASDDTMVENTQQTLTPVESKVTYTKSDVPAGIYRLKAQMKQEETVIGSYSELVRVAGGLSSEAERELGSLNTLYTVTFNANGGTGTMDSQTFISGVEQELSANAFERENYTFSGWSEDKAADAATYTDKAKFTATKDTPLYAVWEANVTIAIEGSTATITIPDDAKDTRVQNAMNEFTADGLNTIIVEGPLNETRQEYIAAALAGKTVTLYLTHLAEDELSEALASADDGITVNCGYYMADASTYVAYNADGLQAWSTYAQTDLTTNLTLAADISLPATTADGTAITVDENGVPSGSNWTPIGTDYNHQFTGTIDGGGHTLSGLRISSTTLNTGFIGYLGTGGAVKNLTLANAVVYSTQSTIGTVVGSNGGSGTVENCHVAAGSSVATPAENGKAGGIVGNNFGLLMGCTHAAAVKGTILVVGIAGVNGNGGRIIACANTGTVDGTFMDPVGVGSTYACWSTYSHEFSSNYGSKTACYIIGTNDGSPTVSVPAGESYAAPATIADAITAMNAAIVAYNANEENAVKCPYTWQLGTDGYPTLVKSE